MIATVIAWMSQFIAAIAFYTTLPVPINWMLEFQWVSRWVVAIGLLIGGALSLLDWGLWTIGMPVLVRSTVVVLVWIAITGGLHLDGAMDTADGLAVQDPQRRLQVMTDSATGAFGAMVAIALILLKVTALSELHAVAPALMLATGWGRWAQQVAIARYPYLKPTGKGAFHKKAISSLGHLIPSLLMLLTLSVLFFQIGFSWQWSLSATLLGGAIALLVPAWFHHRLGGHTGDTYGATVEWTEAIVLVGLTLFKSFDF